MACRASFIALLLVLTAVWAQAARAADGLDRCAAIADDRERLTCYDALAGRAGETPLATTEPAPADQPVPSVAPEATEMARHWDLNREVGILRFQYHKPMYLLPVRYSTDPNDKPFSAFGESEDLDVDNLEAKFQISFKLKLLEMNLVKPADLWVGYTQQNHWQVYNDAASRPFRETNYEPELMLNIHTDYDLLGLRWRFLNLGLVHQSNGRAEPLSRSWNRVYAQFGFDRGPFGLLVRPWYRLDESSEDDDNPDIDDYYGYGDIVAQYRIGEHTLAAMVRGNVREGKGALQLDWTFPIFGRLRGYVQGFTGYGESLIDYNHEQTTIGAGISFADWY